MTCPTIVLQHNCSLVIEDCESFNRRSSFKTIPDEVTIRIAQCSCVEASLLFLAEMETDKRGQQYPYAVRLAGSDIAIPAPLEDLLELIRHAASPDASAAAPTVTALPASARDTGCCGGKDCAIV